MSDDSTQLKLKDLVTGTLENITYTITNILPADEQ